MPSDFLVRFRTPESIAALATELRVIAGKDDDDVCDVVGLVKWLTQSEIKGKGRLELKFFKGEVGHPPARVTYRPLTMHVEEEVWELAMLGDPESNYILAHEVGHVILHDHDAKSFPVSPVKYNLFGMEDISAERQADHFADFLIVPDHILCHYISSEEATAGCGTTKNVMARRWPSRARALKLGRRYIGEACSFCQNFTLSYVASELRCDTCVKDKTK